MSIKVISIGSDRSVCAKGSPAYARARSYAEQLRELHIIVFSLRSHNLKELHEDNLHVYPTNSRSRLLYVRNAARMAGRLYGDVITTQDPFEAGLSGLLGRAGRPLHVQIHTDLYSPAFAQNSFLNRIRLAIAALVLKRAARVRVVSERIKMSLIAKRYTMPISVLPIYVDLAHFSSVQRRVHPRFKRVLLWVGRFEKEKNPALALEAFSRATEKDDALGLIMLGDGRMRPYMQKLAEKFSLAGRVEFPLWQDPLSYFEQADLVLVTSRYEGYGMTTIEALAARVPVLSTDVGIAREVGVSVALPADFPEMLVRELARLPYDPPPPPQPYRSSEEYVKKWCEDIVETRKG